jgi:hypothetical protein
MVMLLTPATWTAATISFQVSEDNATWRDLFDTDGNEVRRPVSPTRP